MKVLDDAVGYKGAAWCELICGLSAKATIQNWFVSTTALGSSQGNRQLFPIWAECLEFQPITHTLSFLVGQVVSSSNMGFALDARILIRAKCLEIRRIVPAATATNKPLMQKVPQVRRKTSANELGVNEYYITYRPATNRIS